MRQAHNFSPDSAINDVARVLRKHGDAELFDRTLAALPDGAIEFWRVQDED